MKSYVCSTCTKQFASRQSLWKHKQRCQEDRSLIGQKRPRTPDIPAYNVGSASSVKRPRSPDIPTFDGAEFGTGKPKSKETMDKLERLVRGEPAKKKSAETQAVLTQVFNAKEPSNIHPQARPKVLPPTTKDKKLHLQRKVIEKPQEVDDGLISFTPMKLEAVHGDVPRLRAVDFVTKQSRTKGNIIGNSDHDDDDQSDDESLDISNIPPPDKVKFLPETVDGLRARFEELIKNIATDRKSGGHEKAGDRNETVFLLDELKRQGGISRRMYRRYNDFLAESLPVEFGIDDDESGDEDVEEMDTSNKEEEQEEKEDVAGDEDEIASVINDIIIHVTQHDKEELGKILIELRDEVGEEFIDNVSALLLLADQFLIKEFHDGEQLLPLIEERRLELEASPASPAKLLRIKILLDNINNNRRRLQVIFQRIDDADDNEEDIWKMLVREGLISDEQFEELKDLENTDIEKISNILKGIKSGQGISFLPTSLAALRYTFGKLWKSGVKDKILPMLEELLRRGGMTDGQYSILVTELDKL